MEKPSSTGPQHMTLAILRQKLMSHQRSGGQFLLASLEEGGLPGGDASKQKGAGTSRGRSVIESKLDFNYYGKIDQNCEI